MDVINPNIQTTTIKQNFILLNLISIFLMLTGLPAWLFTPFLTQSHSWRSASVAYSLMSAAGTLTISLELSQKKRLVMAIQKQDEANLRHAIATSGYLAEQTNLAIALGLLQERQESLQPSYEVEAVEVPEDRGSTDLEESFPTSPTAKVGGVSAEMLEMVEKVKASRKQGLSNSRIIETILGFKGRKYREGKALLGEIDLFLQE